MYQDRRRYPMDQEAAVTRRFITLPTFPPDRASGQILVRCPACKENSRHRVLQREAMVCPWCDFHFPLEADLRLPGLVEEGSFRPLEGPEGPARFGRGRLQGRPLVLALGDPTMRWEKAEVCALQAAVERAQEERLPFLWVVTAPYGTAEETAWAGVQAVLGPAGAEGALRIALIAGPCYGAPAALAMQCDLVLAEPGAVVAAVLPAQLRRAGLLPIESTRSPRDLLRAGWADAVLPRREQQAALAFLLDLLGGKGKGAVLPTGRVPPRSDPHNLIPHLVEPFFELYGDRQGEDDPALIGGLARLRGKGTPLLLLATAGRGRRLEEVSIGGWRKAQRLLHLAARFDLPVVLLLGEPDLRLGGKWSPEAGVAPLGAALGTLFSLPVPTLAVCMGWGGLAGLALATTDRLLCPEAVAAELAGEGVVADATFEGAEDLRKKLAGLVENLTQTYDGSLGRRKLLQRRRVRWARAVCS